MKKREIKYEIEVTRPKNTGTVLLPGSFKNRKAARNYWRAHRFNWPHSKALVLKNGEPVWDLMEGVAL